MKLAGGLALLGAAAFTVCAAPAPSNGDQVIYAVLELFARDAHPDVRDCVRSAVERATFAKSRKARNDWGGWSTPEDQYLSAAAAKRLDRILSAASIPKAETRRGARVSAVPSPMVLTVDEEPKTGPCALEGNKVEVWHLYASRPTFNGKWAFLEVGALADGKYPPPQLWALELKEGRWRPLYKATRTVWYD